MRKFILGYICGVGTIYLLSENAKEISVHLNNIAQKLEEQAQSNNGQQASASEPEPAQQ